jgi:hypothetical protein
MWEYIYVSNDLSQLNEKGAQGWEAVGIELTNASDVAIHSARAFNWKFASKVLMKRRIDTDRHENFTR